MRFDAASRKLIDAAHIVEEQHNMFGEVTHPLTALRYVSRRADTFCEAAHRLIDANGPDLADLTADETIDILVAAAYWEIA